MARVLCVGVATVDIVCRVERYPAEDSEVRAHAMESRMGGNAANTAIMLAQLGHRVHWVGNLGRGAETVVESFARHGVDPGMATHVAGATMPTSQVLISDANGSRTIVHFRDLPEYQARDFMALDLGPFDWVHFEGRPVEQLAPMLTRARAKCGLAVSLEVEKPRSGIEDLYADAGLLLFGRGYAQAHGWEHPLTLLRSLPPGIAATCTWGESGAWAIDRDGHTLHVRPPSLPRVVDTLGAGDVFNAGMVHAVSGGRDMAQALPAAVQLASMQCAVHGLVLGDA